VINVDVTSAYTTPDFDPGRFQPWAEACTSPGDERTPEEIAAALNPPSPAGAKVPRST
jgi:hypothetical protein